MLSDKLPYISIYLLLLILVLLIYQRKEIKNLLPISIFIFCVISYLILDNIPLREYWLLLKLFLSGAFLLPYFLWLFAKALFDDHFIFGRKYILYAGGVLLMYYGVYYVKNYVPLDSFQYLPQLISLFFVFLSVIEAQKNKDDDVIVSRIQFRNIYINLIAVIVVVTLIVEIIIQNGKAEPHLKLAQQIAILGIVTSLMVKLKIDHSFFLKKSIPKPNDIFEDSELEEKILQAFDEEKVYLNEGLTIGVLAEKLQEQEYKIRQVINQNLGFRNFNDLLNQYRIKEACEILNNSIDKKLTILETAYSVGYKSLAPFNKAFKSYTQMTPTEYKKRRNIE